MTTWEDFRDNHTEINCVNGKFYYAYVDGDAVGKYDNRQEAVDELEDAATERLKEDWKYHCQFCNAYFQEEEVEHRISDNRFTAPYGSTFVIGESIHSIAVCPICSGDMEEC